MNKLFVTLWAFFNRQLLERYVSWMSYEIGFVGKGPLATEKPPQFQKPQIPDWLKKEFIKQEIFIRQSRWENFRQACREFTLEDPQSKFRS